MGWSPTGATDDGRIVIGVFGPQMGWSRGAFITTRECGWMRLSDYPVELGVDLDGAGFGHLGFAPAITPDGRTNVGYNSAEGQVWVVTLPD